jgi:acetate---CoA ligase (ADP-forming)
VTALVDTIMNLQRLATDVGEQLESLDVNPLIVRPRGLGVVAVDALAIRAS